MAVTITTTSSVVPDDYINNKTTAIYPVFVDNLAYTSWVSEHVMDNTANHPEKDHFQMKATGATTFEWTILSGSLPTGLTLALNGKISGTPVEEGLFHFRVKVVTEAGNAEKDLSITAFPERSRWLRDARLGVTVHWGRFTDPQIKNSPPRGDGTGTTEFQGRANQFNAANWALQMDNWGAGFIEFSGLWQDSYRNWNSTTPTRYQLHSERGFLDEIVTAFHARNLKVISYFPPDYRANLCETCENKFEWTDGDYPYGNWGGPNLGFVRELVVDKKLDGIWFDIGGASDVYGNPPIVPQWFYWTSVLPVIRYNNPFFIFGVNPGVRDSVLKVKKGGTQVRYPYADFVIYESLQTDSTSATLLETATPLLSKKKTAIYISNQISNRFGWGPLAPNAPIKETQGTLDNIAKNWEAGATVSVALPVQKSGFLLHEHYQPIMTAIGEYVTANKAFSADLEIEYIDGKVVITSPAPARIFYTLDGSEPNTGSHIYSGPIALTHNTKIKARTKEVGKFIGFIKELYVESFPNPDYGRKLFTGTTGDVPKKETADKPYYRGMQFTVGSAPIILTAIGRKSSGAMSGPHDIIIKRYFDEYPVYAGSIKESDTEDNGYRYSNTAEIRLEAGMTYIVCIQENNVDEYQSNAFASVPFSQDVRITAPFILSINGDFFPIPTDKIGQLINLKYRVIEAERSTNFALGKPAVFMSNNTPTYELGASSLYFASNATNGNPEAWARAGGEYAYTLEVDLLTAVKIDRIEIFFRIEAFATQFVVQTSMDKISKTTVAERNDNNAKAITVTFEPLIARYIHIKALQPSAQGQYGGQMAIADLGVFCDNPSFN